MQTRRRRLLMGAALSAVLWPAMVAGTPAWAQSGLGWEVLITGTPDVVMMFDTATQSESPTPIDTVCTGTPAGVAVTPDALFALVACTADNEVVPVDLSTGGVGLGIPVSAGPAVIAITPDGGMALVTSSANELTAIDLEADAVDTVALNGPATDIAITPDGTKAYVTAGASVVPIDLSTGTAGTPIGIGGGPRYLAMAPDGSIVYVATTTGTVIPITTAGNALQPAIMSGLGSLGSIAITPDGTKLYVGESGGPGVVSIDLSGTGGTANPAVATGANVIDLAVAPDGASVYVIGTGPNQIRPITTADDSLQAAVALSTTPIAAVITPDQAPVAQLTATPPNSPVVFDASGSTVMFGTIVSYEWDFGDGTTATTTTPTVSHEYAANGTYTATVTLTSSGGTSLTQVFTGQVVLRNGGPEAQATVTVTYAAPGTLPTTGAKVRVPVAVGVTLLLVGLVMLRLGSRRA